MLPTQPSQLHAETTRAFDKTSEPDLRIDSQTLVRALEADGMHVRTRELAFAPVVQDRPETQKQGRYVARILLVEDDSRMLDALVWLIESEGHRVAQARNGAEALALARSQPPELVVTDYMMPLMNGLDLARALADDPRLSMVPVVLISAIAEPPDPGAFRAFLRKPFAASQLLDLINKSVVRPHD
ncbi:response regulator [Paraburkholderia unamae]|uniref:Response regulator n=1 Tax=Paraburkholderia unamae TaxID=219649 RepID=A0ACC6RNA7_9BURK